MHGTLGLVPRSRLPPKCSLDARLNERSLYQAIPFIRLDHRCGILIFHIVFRIVFGICSYEEDEQYEENQIHHRFNTNRSCGMGSQFE